MSKLSNRLFQTIVLWPLVSLSTLCGLVFLALTTWIESCLDDFQTIWAD